MTDFGRDVTNHILPNTRTAGAVISNGSGSGTGRLKNNGETIHSDVILPVGTTVEILAESQQVQPPYVEIKATLFDKEVSGVATTDAALSIRDNIPLVA